MPIVDGEPFFKMPMATIDSILDNKKISSFHIAAFLVLCCFTDKEGTITYAGKEALRKYAKLQRGKAAQVLNDLHDFKLAVRTEDYKKNFSTRIEQDDTSGVVFFTKRLIEDASLPIVAIARLPVLAAKLLLLAYATHEQQLNLCCDVLKFPFELFSPGHITQCPSYNVWIASAPTLSWKERKLVGFTNGDIAKNINILLGKNLLHRSIAVFDESNASYPEALYYLTPPYPRMDSGSMSLGTRIKNFCRHLGSEIKEGRWGAFSPKDKQAAVVAVYSPYFHFQWKDYKQGLQEYAEKQTEAENTWSEIEKFLEESKAVVGGTKN